MSLRDLHYALRSLRLSPGFALAAIGSIAVGIGGNLTIFSLVNAVLLKPLPYPGADRLVSIRTVSPKGVELGVLGIHMLRWREDVDLVLPAGEVPVGRGVAVGVFVEGVADGIKRRYGDGRRDGREAQACRAEVAAVRRDVEVREVFQVPVDAEEKGWSGCGFDVDVARGAEDAEAVLLAGVVARDNTQVDLRGDLRHFALENGVCCSDQTVGLAGLLRG